MKNTTIMVKPGVSVFDAEGSIMAAFNDLAIDAYSAGAPQWHVTAGWSGAPGCQVIALESDHFQTQHLIRVLERWGWSKHR